MNYQIYGPLGLLKDEDGKELIFPSKDFAERYLKELSIIPFAPKSAINVEWDFHDDEVVELGGIKFNKLRIQELYETVKNTNISVYEKGLIFDPPMLEGILEGFVDENRNSKQAIIQWLIDEDIEFCDDGDIIEVRISREVFDTELLLSYGIRFNKDEELYKVNAFIYHYETESTLRNEEIKLDQMIDEIRRYTK